MTTISLARETPRKSAAGHPAGIVQRVRYYLARSRAERQLADLDDRLLADIGLKRSDIHTKVWGN
jgi:uncharacterized protein YjiS (DUF1127 family)